MKYVWIIMVLISVYSCKKNTTKNNMSSTYLQAEEVQLVSPKIEAKSVLIDTSSSVTAVLPLDKAIIYYTTDGSDPNETSKRYTSTISISKPGKYAFKAFHPEFKPSETGVVSFFNRGIDVHDISLKTPLNEQYPGQGQNTLVNHQKGSLNFRDGQWIGVTEPVIAIVDFKDMIFLESLDIGYLINTNAWIFPIQEVFISFSENGNDFIPIETNKNLQELTKDITKQDNMNIPIFKKLRKIRIEIANTKSIPKWHPGNGNPAWLFMDEWIFNTRNN